MARTLVVTDSNAGLTLDEQEGLGVAIVPITILLPDGDGIDGVMDPDVVFDALARDEPVKSSPPRVIDYLDAFEAGDASDVVVLTPAAEFTAMHRNAAEAAALSHRRVSVIDTRTAAAAQRLVVIEAARAAHGGASHDDVVAVARDAVGRAELIAALDRVTTIEHSGRVPSDVIETVQRHRTRPLFRFEDGVVTPIEATSGDVLADLERAWRSAGGPDASQALVFHAAAAGRAERLRSRLGIDAPPVVFSPAIALHTGPGVVGVAWLRRS